MEKKGRLYIGTGQPLQEVGEVKDFKKNSEIEFNIVSNANTEKFEKLKELLLNDIVNTFKVFHSRIDEFCKIFVEDYLGFGKYEEFNKEYAKKHKMSCAFSEEEDCFYGIVMDGKLYNVGGLLLTWPETRLADVNNPYWANDKILEKLKSLNIEC